MARTMDWGQPQCPLSTIANTREALRVILDGWLRLNTLPMHHLAMLAPELHRPATSSILSISDRSLVAFSLKLSEMLDVAGEPVHEIEVPRPRPRPTPDAVVYHGAVKRPSHRGYQLGRLQEPDGPLRHHARLFAPAPRRHSLSSTHGRIG